MDSYILTIEREVLRWPGVTSEPGRFGATSFRYGKREIGHIHRDRIADLPVTPEMRDEILSNLEGPGSSAQGRGKGLYKLPRLRSGGPLGCA